MKKCEAIKQFLKQSTLPDLAELYSEEMELQVKVDNTGKSIVGETKEGHKWTGYTDGKETWKNLRIPWNSGEYIDNDLTFSTDHFQAIGMSGWNWKQKKSIWVGFDFDSIIGHKTGLTLEEIVNIKTKVNEIEWITVRASTSGMGLHIYVFIENSPIIETRQEHIALARSILGLIVGRLGFPLHEKVDTYGTILWQWHREKRNGLQLLKQGTKLVSVPKNWKDHIAIVSGTRKRTIINDEKEIDKLTTTVKNIPLSPQHLKVLEWFEINNTLSWWDPDRNMFVCHTYDLQLCHRELKLKGIFETNATGKDRGQDQNCFMFPLSEGWVVRRHGKNTIEQVAWGKDKSGWTRIYYDRQCDLPTACRCLGGSETIDGSYIFRNLESALDALKLIGVTVIDEPGFLLQRLTTIQITSEGYALLSVVKEPSDPWIEGWAPKGKTLEKVYRYSEIVFEVSVPDDMIRFVTLGGTELGWYVKVEANWLNIHRTNIIAVLRTLGLQSKEATPLLGRCIFNHWTLVCKPFEPEYPGGREWNVKAPQAAFLPIQGTHPHWDKLIGNIGKNLDPCITKEMGIKSGYEYILMWIAFMFRHPTYALPYLFLHSEDQDTGKSIFHEALRLLLKDGMGYIHAEHALSTRFNGELANSILCIIEEIDFSNDKNAYAKIKDWVTGKTISIHIKGMTPYTAVNTTHWIQCANNITACPVFPGDTRIVFIEVDAPPVKIPKGIFEQKLLAEAAAFMHTIMELKLPEITGRLALPVLTSGDKQRQEELNRSVVEQFLMAETYERTGHALSIKEAFEQFIRWLPNNQAPFWNQHRFTREIPKYIIKGRYGNGGQNHLANRTLSKEFSHGPIPLVRENDKLIFADKAEQLAEERYGI